MRSRVPPTALLGKAAAHLARSTVLQSTLLSHVPTPTYFYYGGLETQPGGTVGGRGVTHGTEPSTSPSLPQCTSPLLPNVTRTPHCKTWRSSAFRNPDLISQMNWFTAQPSWFTDAPTPIPRSLKWQQFKLDPYPTPTLGVHGTAVRALWEG